MPKDSLTNSSEMRTKLVCCKFSDCKSLVKSALYSWDKLSVSELFSHIQIRVILLLKVIQNCVYKIEISSPCVFWFVVVLKNEPNLHKFMECFGIVQKEDEHSSLLIVS